ncbi:MAG: enoyl-CoA hydratase-related protein [candidate division KSB1 bacterium]|nr:enoyl-CoA hydratase-related protein [candidate division KSB1 bacterium]
MAEFTHPHVEVTRSGLTTTVTIRRPEAHNALDEQVIAQLKNAFKSLHEDRKTRIVIMAGAGPSFSAGADLNWMRRAASYSEDENRRDAGELAAMLRAVAECPRPVIARVQGAALGAGAGLVAAADIVVAAESAQFGFTEVRLGLVPATVSPYVIDKIGPGRARQLFLTGERFHARHALEIGLVYRVVPDAQLDAAVQEVSAMLLAGGPSAQGACKQLIRHVAMAGSEVDDYTSDVIARIRASEEGREGVMAFLEKRKPNWLADGKP